MALVTAHQLAEYLGVYAIKGTTDGVIITNAANLAEADESSLTFTTTPNFETKARAVICPFKNYEEIPDNGKTLIFMLNPRLAFTRAVNFFFTHWKPSIDPTAIIHSCVHLGRDVTVKANSVIGGDGFGYARNENGEYEKFPHLANVIIGDNTDIGACCCIDRGSLTDTVIGYGTKLDNLVHVAHSAKIGNRCIIVAHVFIGGNAEIGDDCFLGANCTIRDHVKVGAGATIGMGANVLNDVPVGATWVGNPARLLR